MSEPELNPAELRMKLENLERSLRERQDEKKRDNKLKNDEIKEIRDEISLCLDDLEDAGFVDPDPA